MRNLEIKVQVSSFDEIRSRLGDAAYYGAFEQKDTYYLLGKRRLKVREEKTKGELIFYTRPMKNGTRESSYHRLGILHFFVPLVKFLLSLCCGTKVIVEKSRNLFLFKHTRIHLDTVLQLGTYAELETVIPEEGNDALYESEHAEVKRRLSLDQYPVIPGSYSDLLMQRKER